MIILDENKYASEIILNGITGKKIYEPLCCVARYYKERGYSNSDILKRLEFILLRNDPNVSLSKWSKFLEKIVSKSGKRKNIAIDSIPITESELNIISEIKNKPTKRLAFTLLCIAKYRNMINDKNNNWVNTNDREIARMANIKTSIKRESKMYSDLKDLGLIEFAARADNLNVRVMFIQDDSTAIEINDFRNLGNQYLMLTGETYYKCECCGLVTKYSKRKPKYCKDCAIKIALKQRVDSVMRQRSALCKA